MPRPSRSAVKSSFRGFAYSGPASAALGPQALVWTRASYARPFPSPGRPRSRRMTRVPPPSRWRSVTRAQAPTGTAAGSYVTAAGFALGRVGSGEAAEDHGDREEGVGGGPGGGREGHGDYGQGSGRGRAERVMKAHGVSSVIHTRAIRTRVIHLPRALRAKRARLRRTGSTGSTRSAGCRNSRATFPRPIASMKCRQ